MRRSPDISALLGALCFEDSRSVARIAGGRPTSTSLSLRRFALWALIFDADSRVHVIDHAVVRQRAA